MQTNTTQVNARKLLDQVRDKIRFKHSQIQFEVGEPCKKISLQVTIMSRSLVFY
ncbi:hypothetical protein NSMM_820023 [Nitrosomonas mobilis]|uniref:Uncharacterized protein n=1 Tax=Nitrosomonas mobilis TaxID=51642 RepID=A0A1G5SIH0_9PROT|nr:hypothetical protein NSMM_820023 [Nitrosomonas mobilis]